MTMSISGAVIEILSHKGHFLIQDHINIVPIGGRNVSKSTVIAPFLSISGASNALSGGGIFNSVSLLLSSFDSDG